MELWFWVVLIILGNYIILHYRYDEINIIKHGAISVTMFFVLYAVISGIAFWFDMFSFLNVLLVQFLTVLTTICVLLYKHGRKKVCFDFLVNRDAVALLFILVSLILTIDKFGLFSVAQDQGLYQAEAIELYMGNFELQHDLEEYQILDGAEDRALYQEMVHTTWLGYYPLKMSGYKGDLEVISDVSGMYHGVQTYPAMLALIGRLFGMDNMFQLQTILFICSVLFLYYTMEQMKIRRSSCVLLTMIYMLSPLAIWISKATYTEMFLSLMVCLYLYFLFEANDKKWILSIPLIGFSFVHVSFLLLWPIFWIVNTVMYIHTDNKQYISANNISAIGLVVGNVIMAKIAPIYYYGNCARLFFKNVITQENLLIWIGGVALLSCIVSYMIMLYKGQGLKKLLTKFQTAKWIVPILLCLSLIFWVVYGIKTGYFMLPEDAARTDLSQHYGQGLMAYTHLAIYACALATGFIIVPCIIGNMIVGYKKIVVNVEYFVLTLLFLYIVIFQSISFRIEIGFYYYYSRYLLYYIPIICIMAAICFEKWKKQIVFLISITSFCFMLYYDVEIFENKDDTLWEWETLEDLSVAIEDNSAVILNDTGMQRLLGPQLRAAASVAVFPVFTNNNEQISMLTEHYENVYILSEKELDEKVWNIEQLDIMYKDQYQYSRKLSHLWGFYPKDIVPISKSIVLYQVTGEVYKLGEDILFSTENRTADKYVVQGLSYNEKDFSWTAGESLSMEIWMDKNVANKKVKAIFEVLNVYNGKQTVDFIVNGNKLDSIILNGGGQFEFEFTVPPSGLIELELSFPDAVSPQELGRSEDARKLALGLVKATITEVE